MKTKTLALTVSLLMLTGIAAAQSSNQIEITKKTLEPTPLQSSEYADIWLEVSNTGSTAANDVEIEFLENYPFSVDPGDKTSWSLGELVPGESGQIHLEAKVDENAVHGENMLEFKTTVGSENIELEKKVPVEVRTDSSILSISNVDFQEKVAPGASETMTVTLENMADSQIKNIEAKLGSEQVPAAASDSNIANLRKIEPGKSRNVSFQLNIDESAENGVFKLPLTLEYENEAGTSFSVDSTTALVVGGEPDLQLGVNDAGTLTSGSTGTVTLRLINSGEGSADFVDLEVQESDSYELLSSSSEYIGEMDPDDYQTIELRLHVSEDAENLQIPVEIGYKSDSQKSETQTVDVKLYTSQELERYGLTSSGSIMPLIVVVLLAVGGIYYWRKRRER